MPKQQLVPDQWQALRVTLEKKLDDGYSNLVKATANATATFDGRIEKVQGPLADLLRGCRDTATLNARLADAQHQFCRAQLSTVDAAVRNTSNRLTAAAKDAGLPALGAEAELSIVAPLIVSTSKMVVEALCLCWLLSALLGHKEADAFVHGAKDELIGAIGDPGAGVLTLLKRLYAVGTRTLRKDQDTAELLVSLAEFESLMEKWRAVAGRMAEDVRFDKALDEVFKSG